MLEDGYVKYEKKKVCHKNNSNEIGGFHFSYIGGVERGEKNISLLNLVKIADALEVDVHHFFSYAMELEKLTEKDGEIKEILILLQQQEKEDINKAKNILKELFK